MTDAGRTTIDITNADDVAFFTPMLKKMLKKAMKAGSAESSDDDEKPKKAQNSYMEFCKEARQTNDFSDIKDPKEVSRRLGQMWKDLPDDEKTVYKQRADENKKEYSVKKAAHDDVKAKTEKPKKPLSPYIRFCNANRAEVGKTVSSPQDVSRRLGQMWRELTIEQRDAWKQDVAPVVAVAAEAVPVAASAEIEKTEKPKKTRKSKEVPKENDVNDVIEEKAAEAAPVEIEKTEKPKKTRKSKESSGDEQEEKPKKSRKAKKTDEVEY